MQTLLTSRSAHNYVDDPAMAACESQDLPGSLEESAISSEPGARESSVQKGLTLPDSDEAIQCGLPRSNGPCHMLRSFDMIFGLQQRSEETRSHMEAMDRILLKSRSVAELAQQVIPVLEDQFDLIAARILLHPGHLVASAVRGCRSYGTGTIPGDLVDREGIFSSDPFVLDDPTGDLAYTLFGPTAHLVASAAVASLAPEDHELGLLCLGSHDPHRYCGDVSMDLIGAIADKIALGILNAWDHEQRERQTPVGSIEGLYTEQFFTQYLHKEFNRAWRSLRPFSIMAVSWQPEAGSSFSGREQVHEFFVDNVRSADLVALGEEVDAWILLPEASQDAARMVAQRLRTIAADHFSDELRLSFGITSFSRNATCSSAMMEQACKALETATEHPMAPIVTCEAALCS